ncbi:S4-like RNA binding domain [Liquorilactobacillus sucicola DSM 21376 = JCM 15457]|uniref:RNA binding protein n=1 Tax=Liquorilactobacillus sucicola DSM 21376 = JCM 15457 TaxID=1423806 RepID=A0A023CU36_9LACO|nr:YlmH/Sll1252 family protein [Liquorilactobacillus sucicola]KRN05262.1 RNA binding protein [Liquorilactobacillus sucicola DSM 21376 = JCM 15457]GAJ25322.1 S4-like RNA binding domain [Liquorilactobacillus sucicola DSM 21376 = JCM 15457]
MSEDSVYQHFRKEEATVIDEIQDVLERVRNEYRPILTRFFNPRERLIASSLLRNDEIKMKSFGLAPNAERKRVLFYPSYYEPDQADFEIALMRINYPTKFAALQHRQVLGTLMNIGIKRDVIGDIMSDGEQWQIIVDAQMADYIRLQVDHVGRIKVSMTVVPDNQLVSSRDEWLSKQLSVSSLRIDVLIAGVYNLSRKQVKDLLQAQKVHLNWMLVEKPDAELGRKDIVSVRGHGRFRMDYVRGVSKKGRIRLDVSVLEN